MQQLSPQDAQFLYMETDNNLAHVTSVSIFDPATVPDGKTVRFKDIIAHVASRLDCSPMLRRKLVRVPLELDYPYWVDDEFFDLEYHIHHGRLPRPGDWRQFCIHLARYHSRPLDMSKPLWDMYVVEGLDHIKGLPTGCYAIAIKIHHAAADGASLMRFFNAMMDKDNRGTPVLPLESFEPEESPQPNIREMARRAASNNLRSPVRIADALLRSAPDLYSAAQRAFKERGDARQSIPKTRFNVDVSRHKMFDAVEFALDDLKAIRRLVEGCTLNDVVLAVCSGGLRRYLEHHGELPTEPLIAWVPINARAGGASDTDAPGNNISAMTVAIHTDQSDPQQRLESIARSTALSKQAKSGMSARLMTDLTRHVPAATQVMVSRLVLQTGLAASVCNLFISNVPGPQFPLYMNGAKQVGSYGMAPLGDGMGLFIGTPSYNGRMSFNVISTRDIMPDIRFFIECLEDSLQELLRLANTKATTRTKAKTKAKTKARTKAAAKVSRGARTATAANTGSAAKAGKKAAAGAKNRPKTKPKPRSGK